MTPNHDPAAQAAPRRPPAAAIELTWSVLPVAVGGAAAAALGAWEPLMVGVLVAWLALTARTVVLGRRRAEALARLNAAATALADGDGAPFEPPDDPDLAGVVGALYVLRLRLGGDGDGSGETVSSDGTSWLASRPLRASLSRGGPIEGAVLEAVADPSASGEFAGPELTGRLDPRTLRWLDASPAALAFLGDSLDELRGKTFPDVVHADHRELAREQLLAAVVKGEARSLVYRVQAARGVRSVEMNVGVRYAPDGTPQQLRCHLADVTDRLRAGRELRRRIRELIQANEQLRRVNRELEELKDRYSDLYQNAPAMYFSLDEGGIFRECNNTLLQALGYRPRALMGRPYRTILAADCQDSFAERFAEFLREGFVEVESRWRKADGSLIDVWVRASAVRAPDGTLLHSRSVAQDITARKALEAELRDQARRLARANEELSRTNKELDEFSYVVSHDLQEPLRSLNAFSGFLIEDYGDRLDEAGRGHLGHIIEASRRMRALIQDLLALSRAGRAAADFSPVDPMAVLDRVRADLSGLIHARGAELRIVGPLPALWGDRDRLAQLFANLIGNGLKYNRGERPWVEVGPGPDDEDGRATLYVRDNGIGIDPKFHGKIFQVFRRLHPREEFEGTGAGLAICQKIVRAHGGRIWVDSRKGEGATFFVSLPTRAADPPRPRTELLHEP